jgi:hypothetical protein
MSYSGDYLNFHNSFGCGKSVRWEYEAIHLAKKNGEDCGHFDIDSIIVKIKRSKINPKLPPYCKVKCPVCNNNFPITSNKLTQEFLEFYRRTSDR